MNDLFQNRWFPILFLTASNVFMTFAWYGHLKFKQQPLWLVILASWGIAFFEYCLMVPANRWGHDRYSTIEPKIIQEVVTRCSAASCRLTWESECVGTIWRLSHALSPRWPSHFCRPAPGRMFRPRPNLKAALGLKRGNEQLVCVGELRNYPQFMGI